MLGGRSVDLNDPWLPSSDYRLAFVSEMCNALLLANVALWAWGMEID